MQSQVLSTFTNSSLDLRSYIDRTRSIGHQLLEGRIRYLQKKSIALNTQSGKKKQHLSDSFMDIHRKGKILKNKGPKLII